jgi:murein DD-endopeptidase MepM/ murein hydrolase activator NlpD
MIVVLLSGFFLGFSVFSNAGSAVSKAADEQDLMAGFNEKDLTPQEFDQKSEDFKNRILSEDEEASSGKDYISYTVKPGDTLSTISSRFRVPVHLISKSSGIRSDSTLRVGQKITIPNRPGIYYRIKAGDRLARVASYYSVSIEDIEKDNPSLHNLDLLPVGASIFLPNAKIPEPPPMWSMPAAGRITSGYGYRAHPITGGTQFHGGIDIAVSYAPVRAARDGTVIYAGPMGSYGNAIIIKHDSEFKTLYAHLSWVSVRTGQQVKRGYVIGTSGNTGFSTGPHLHFEVIYKGRAVPPFKYVRFR